MVCSKHAAVSRFRVVGNRKCVVERLSAPSWCVAQERHARCDDEFRSHGTDDTHVVVVVAVVIVCVDVAHLTVLSSTPQLFPFIPSMKRQFFVYAIHDGFAGEGEGGHRRSGFSAGQVGGLLHAARPRACLRKHPQRCSRGCRYVLLSKCYIRIPDGGIVRGHGVLLSIAVCGCFACSCLVRIGPGLI